MQLEARSPATGEPLGAVEESTREAVLEAAARAAAAQPLWGAVPPAARARYVRRAARLALDELDNLGLLLARESGRPRTEAILGELLPAIAGLGELADDAPGALADRRLGRPALLRGGRRAIGVQQPRGVVGVLGAPASPWAEPALEVAASLLAGNGVLVAPAAPLAGERLRRTFLRAGIPEELLAAVGRVVCVPSLAEPLLAALRERAAGLRVGDPATEAAEIGPLRSAEDLAAVGALVEEAVAGGAELVCGGPTRVPGLAGAFYAPAVLRRVPAGARILAEPAPGPVLAVVEARGEAEAIALAGEGEPGADPDERRARGGVVSVWTGDRAKGERVARTLTAELTWINEHGAVAPGPALRLQRHVASRQVASRPAVLGGARRLPYDPALVRARTAATRLVHGRESDRLAVLRRDARPLARAALRVGAGLLRR